MWPKNTNKIKVNANLLHMLKHMLIHMLYDMKCDYFVWKMLACKS